jgi:hypothetical protein
MAVERGVTSEKQAAVSSGRSSQKQLSFHATATANCYFFSLVTPRFLTTCSLQGFYVDAPPGRLLQLTGTRQISNKYGYDESKGTSID